MDLIEYASNFLAAATMATPMSGGVSALYFPINDKWGFKFWYNPELRDEVYEAQKAGYELGLAPAVGERMDTLYDGTMVYGYITQAVEMLPDRHPETLEMGIHTLHENFEEVRDLKVKLKEHDMCPWDLHKNNMGYMPDGRLVLIDWGFD